MIRKFEGRRRSPRSPCFVEPGGKEIVDGFKRVRAARALGWSTLLAHVDQLAAIDAKTCDTEAAWLRIPP